MQSKTTGLKGHINNICPNYGGKGQHLVRRKSGSGTIVTTSQLARYFTSSKAHVNFIRERGLV